MKTVSSPVSAALLALACILFSAPAGAEPTPLRGTQKLTFVAESGVPGQALCHLTYDLTVLDLPIWTRSQGYALAGDTCKATDFTPFSAADMVAAQAAGRIDAALPVTPRLGLIESIGAYALTSLGGLVVLTLLVFRMLGRGAERRLRGVTRVSPAVAGSMLEAMCRIAKADGYVDDRRVAIVRNIYTQLTGETVEESALESMLLAVPYPVQPVELESLAEGLTAKERKLMMQATLMVAVADGRIRAPEHSLITSLADAMRISGDELRQMLSRITPATYAA